MREIYEPGIERKMIAYDVTCISHSLRGRDCSLDAVHDVADFHMTNFSVNENHSDSYRLSEKYITRNKIVCVTQYLSKVPSQTERVI